VAHGDLIDVLDAELTRRGLAVRAEAYAMQRAGALLFGVIDLAWRDTGEFAAAIGLRTSNDKTFSLQIAVGLRIFVCDNLVFSGDLIALKRKHTAGLDLPREIAAAMERYQNGVLNLENGIGRLKATAITDGEAKEKICDLFRQTILPVRLFHAVCRAHFEDANGGTQAPRTLWGLHNACTCQMKALPPAPAFQAHARLGRLFGLTRNSSLGSHN
jgi:hypothetical protein